LPASHSMQMSFSWPFAVPDSACVPGLHSTQLVWPTRNAYEPVCVRESKCVCTCGCRLELLLVTPLIFPLQTLSPLFFQIILLLLLFLPLLL
jgi:hypothetical protein